MTAQIVEPNEQSVRVVAKLHVAHRVVSESERREGARGHVKIVRVTVVSAIIITRNRKDALETVLGRLVNLPVDEVIVVDNGSEDGTAELVRSHRSRVTLLEPGENLGTAGRNLAADEAKGELLLMLDDDAYPMPGAVETLVAAFEANPKLAVAAGFVRDIDEEGNVLRQDEPGTFDWWLRAGRTGNPPEGFLAFSFPEGASMIRRDAYLEADGFFAPFLLASEGVDLATRLTALGYEVRYFPSAVFEHMKAESERLGPDLGLYYRIRNHLWFIWLRFPAPVAVRRTAGYLAFDLVESSYRGVPGAWWRGVRDAWRMRDQVRGERRPLPRPALRRAELNRGRMHVRLLLAQARRRLPSRRSD